MARASNLVIGTATLTVIAVAFGGLLGVQKWRASQSRSQLRVVFEGGSASGLRSGGPVNFDGVPAGQILSIKLESPRKVVALVSLDNAAPLRKDTVAGIEFQGLTGVAAVSLIGGAPSAPPVPLDDDGIPVLIADLSDAESIVDTLHSVDRTIVSNAPAIKDGLRTFEDHTADLRGRGDEVDTVLLKVDDAFAGFDKAVAKIEGAVPGFIDGKTDELFEKLKGLHELADTMKKKSASFLEYTRRSLLDLSEAANKMSGMPAAAVAPRPPRKPAQQKR